MKDKITVLGVSGLWEYQDELGFMLLIRGLFWDQQDLLGHVYASVESLMLEYETDQLPSQHCSRNLSNLE